MAVESRTAANTRDIGPGIYLGQIVSHLDPKYTGRLEIEILKQTESGNLTERTGQTIQAQYMSPFYGVTPYKNTTRNNTYDYTQKSYGFWAIPPDVGTKVIVLMVEGNYGQAYWIGCVQDEYMNFMVPGYAGTTYNNLDPSKMLPVGEYNKRVETGEARDPTKFIKPASQDLFNVLTEQGLVDDHIRGTTTSSARREVPSMVFGISTPGPVDRLGPRGSYGTQTEQVQTATSRLGGSSFVMDDGDMTLLRRTPAGGETAGPMDYANAEAGDESGNPEIPYNELVRIKTRTGHQILLHNSEDLIYIGNSKGTTWIELTSNGKIDIYAKDSVSVHTENDYNVTADRDINLTAGGNINLNAGSEARITSGADTSLLSAANIKLTSSGGKVYMNSSEAASEAPKPKRVPQHEPWSGHEHLNATLHTPELTQATTEAPPEDEAFVFPPVPDTFRKSS